MRVYRFPESVRYFAARADELLRARGGRRRWSNAAKSHRRRRGRRRYAVDLDGDADNDLVAASFKDHAIQWYDNGGHAANSFSYAYVDFTANDISTSFKKASDVYAVDVDGDAEVDVLGAAYKDEEISWWYNDGDEDFSETVIASTGKTYNVYAVDVDGDADVDVVSATNEDDSVSWFANNGAQSFAETVIDSSAGGAIVAHVGDVDDDGDQDILLAAYDDRRGTLEAGRRVASSPAETRRGDAAARG